MIVCDKVATAELSVNWFNWRNTHQELISVAFNSIQIPSYFRVLETEKWRISKILFVFQIKKFNLFFWYLFQLNVICRQSTKGMNQMIIIQKLPMKLVMRVRLIVGWIVYLPKHVGLTKKWLVLGSYLLCWISRFVPFNTCLISIWEENNYCYKLSNGQNDNYFHSKWQLWPF